MRGDEHPEAVVAEAWVAAVGRVVEAAWVAAVEPVAEVARAAAKAWAEAAWEQAGSASAPSVDADLRTSRACRACRPAAPTVELPWCVRARPTTRRSRLAVLDRPGRTGTSRARRTDMPMGDGTGPFGAVPRSGWGGGWCRGPRGGYGGHGLRHWYRATGLPGWRRAGWSEWWGEHEMPVARGEREWLRRQAEDLEAELRRVRERLQQLGDDRRVTE
jgi:hypothetical protein